MKEFSSRPASRRGPRCIQLIAVDQGTAGTAEEGIHVIAGTAVFWIAIALIVLISSVFRHLTRASEQRMLEKLAEKGQTFRGGRQRPERT
ncbi:MAG: hypothetical protein KGJ78_08110 [Alphaproteobacteria bacterium]|nr:hypothetical protein [Alphaproteobacteria bacterium]